MRSKSVDYHRERLIRQIRTARQSAAECTQQAQQRMKLYYDQHAIDHTFRVGHKVWTYNPAVKQGFSKKIYCLWHGPFRLVDQVTQVYFEVTNIQGKLQKGSVQVNRMKQYFKYDDPPVDSPPQRKPIGNPLEYNYKPLQLFTEPPSTREIEK